ncbi:leucyl aminopeptidase [Chiayiivirga flava]|uniref:Probable cytosol aminopeptidase n=1 Tax=Chiayiivirga flava TaxID=659595 RepID=A0A7W8D8S8_9GAMM|nr:leucyl aminopeptidase [Chiayiivirga flava]MBB5208681.1 leucyl aminopeptidase [Chiayiivirga flava]
MSLNLSLLRTRPAEVSADAIVVAVFEDTGLSPAAADIDAASGGKLARLVESGDISGKPGRVALLHALDGVAAPRVLAVGVGEAGKLDTGRYLKACSESLRSLKGGPVKHVHTTLPELAVSGRDDAWKLRQAALAAFHVSYTYTATRKAGNGARLERLTLVGDDASADALRVADGIAAGVRFARELGNLPPNICNPAYLAAQSMQLAREHAASVTCEVLERADMETLGMGSLLGVAQGSANPPKLIVLRYTGAGDAKPHVLVGKGITFDSGGLSLKPGAGMEEMKFDMCGAATVLGSFLSAVKLALPINLAAVVAAVENMPDGNAYRPSDVLTSMSGQTIEVLNTDAEGRLILCDALTYAQRLNPATLIDVATLTGACVVALGKHAHGLMSKHDDLADELLAAGLATHDRAWRLPLWDDYQPMLDSGSADMANIGGKWAGAITAGCFLARFTDGQRWAHLDIAGTAWDEGRKGLATGRPVPLLTQWLMDRT